MNKVTEAIFNVNYLKVNDLTFGITFWKTQEKKNV